MSENLSFSAYKNQLVITAITIFVAVVAAVLLSVVLVKSMINSQVATAHSGDQQASTTASVVPASSQGASCVSPGTGEHSASSSNFSSPGHGGFGGAGTVHKIVTNTNTSSSTTTNNSSTNNASQNNSQQTTNTSTGLVNVGNGAISGNNTNIASFNQNNLNDLLDVNLLNEPQDPLLLAIVHDVL